MSLQIYVKVDNYIAGFNSKIMIILIMLLLIELKRAFSLILDMASVQ